MPAGKNIFDDLAKVAGGATAAFDNLKSEVDRLVRHQLERLLAGMEMVPRDEFDAVKEMAAKARAEQEKLADRVAELEARIDGGASKRSRPAAKPKGSPGKRPARKPPASKPPGRES